MDASIGFAIVATGGIVSFVFCVYIGYRNGEREMQRIHDEFERDMPVEVTVIFKRRQHSSTQLQQPQACTHGRGVCANCNPWGTP